MDVDFVGPLEKNVSRSRIAAEDVGLHLLPDALFARFINGVKLSEYTCAGLPIVCSALEGPLELVRGKGFPVKPGDLRDFAEKMAVALEPGHEQLAQRSEEIAQEEFSQAAIECKAKMLADFLKGGVAN